MAFFAPQLQVTEPKKKLESLKVYPEDMEWVRDEQRRIKKREPENDEPTQAEVFIRLRAFYERADSGTGTKPSHPLVPEPPFESLSVDARRMVEILRSILESGYDTAIRAITTNLGAFDELVRLKDIERFNAVVQSQNETKNSDRAGHAAKLPEHAKGARNRPKNSNEGRDKAG